MPTLILIKHAKPQVLPEIPSDQWPLSDEGRRLCEPLAERVRGHQPQVVVSSEEPKAAETGRIIAERLGVPFETAPGLHEHDRSNVPHMPTREFISYMALFFKKPDEQVLGLETAKEARERLTGAIDEVLARHPDQNVAIVTHGTVLALYAAETAGREAFATWRAMGLPSFIAFDRSEMRPIEVCDAV